jgi:hypothetical protein
MMYLSPDRLKRLLSIFFLILFLFNAGGYYALHWILSVKAEHELMTQIENEKYDPVNEVTLTIPMALPYGEIGADQYFRKMHGEFEYNGDQYKFIKQKFQNDTLYLVCIKNASQKKVDGALADYSKAANNFPSQSKQTLHLLSKLFKDFHPTASITLSVRLIYINTQMIVVNSLTILDHTYPVLSPPPEKLS